MRKELAIQFVRSESVGLFSTDGDIFEHSLPLPSSFHNHPHVRLAVTLGGAYSRRSVFVDEQTKVQRGEVTGPRLHMDSVSGLGFGPRAF